MARQRFLDGDFIGKIGDVIVKNYHDIKVVQPYTKPKYTAYPAQVNMRNKFKLAIKYAQIAMSLTYKWGFFDTTKTGEFQMRVGQSKKKIDIDDNGLLSVPLTPLDGPYIITPSSINIAKVDQRKLQITIFLTEIYDNILFDVFLWTISGENVPIIYTTGRNYDVDLNQYTIEIADVPYETGQTVFFVATFRQNNAEKTPKACIIPTEQVVL